MPLQFRYMLIAGSFSGNYRSTTETILNCRNAQDDLSREQTIRFALFLVSKLRFI